MTSSNILGDATEISDTGLHLRGILEKNVTTEAGRLDLAGSLDMLSYRHHRFADRQSVGFRLRQEFDPVGPLSISAGLAYGLSDAGDDIVVSGLALALRQRVQSVTADADAKLALPHGLVADLSLANRYDDVGKARFVASLPDTKVNPDVDDLTGSLALARVHGPLQYALVARLEKVRLFQQTAFQNAVPFSSYGLRVRMIFQGDAWKATGELGMTRLRDAYGLYDEARPVYLLDVERRFGDRFDLSGKLECNFNTADTDDPLATYEHRIELQATLKAGGKTLLGAGVFAVRGPDLLLGEKERGWGTYGAVSYRPTQRVSFLLRVDYKKLRDDVVNDDHDTWTARLGMQSKL